MSTDDALREGKRRAAEMIRDAFKAMKKKYGNIREDEPGTPGKAGADVVVTNQELLAKELGRDPSGVSRMLNPKHPDRFDEREIEIIVEKLELTPSQRLDLRRWYDYESTANTNLPEALPDFVGRDEELRRIRLELGRTRLLTITGVGGCGKTRLAMEYARTAVGAYPDGVWFVDLARLARGDDGLAPMALASVLKVRELPGMALTESIVRRLAKQRALIILDNCEHVVTGSALLAGAILRGTDSLKIIATSRQALVIDGERDLLLAPLHLPDERAHPNPAHLEQVEAVALFLARARLSRPQMALTARNAPAVIDICRRLEGIPLALELAAARLRIYAPDELADELRDPLAALNPPGADGGRQHTLERLLAWSFALLSPEEQRVFRRLAVFSGGWTLEQARAVCGGEDIEPRRIDTLVEELMAKSLVLRTARGDEKTRFSMLDTVRAYATARLNECGEAEAVAMRHRDCFVTAARPVELALNGPQQARVLEELTPDQENFRAALRHAISTGDREAELGLAADLWKFWQVRGLFSEGRQALMQALSRATDTPWPVHARALSAASILATDQGDLDGARVLAERALALRDAQQDHLGVARSHLVLGRLARMQGDWQQADRHWKQSLEMHRRLKQWVGLADALANRGLAAAKQGDYDTARRRFDGSMRLMQWLGLQLGIGMVLDNQGSVAMEQGAYAHARELHERSRAIAGELNHQQLAAAEYDALGRIAYLEGDYSQARDLHTESLKLRERLEDVGGIARCQRHLADVEARTGELAAARGLAEESFTTARACGDQEAIANALATLAYAALREGRTGQARTQYQQSLDICRRSRYRLGMAAGIEAVARLAAEGGNHLLAARLIAAAARAREEMETPLPPIDRNAHADVLAHLRSRLGEDGFTRAWAEGRDLTLDYAVALAASLK